METPQAPGWYDDPERPDLLRYFDGVIWTNHTTPRRTRQVQEPVGQPPQDSPRPRAPRGPSGAQGEAPPWRHPSQQSWQQPPQAQSPEQDPSRYAPQQYQRSPYPGPDYPPAAEWTTPYAAPGQPATPDGVPLASYGVRVAAFFMDGIIRYLLVLLFGGYFLYQAVQPVMDTVTTAIQNGDVTAYMGALDQIDSGPLAWFSVVTIAVAVVYNIFFLVRWGATPGKLIANISVRLRDRPGTPSFSTALRRYGFVAVLNLLGNVPGLALVTLPVWAIDLLFPLWDPQRQALHDKVAGTVVVVGRQRRTDR